MSTIRLAARPQEIRFSIQEAALVVVDMQNDFCANGGSVERAGFDIAPVRALIPPISRLLDRARPAGLQVYYLRHGYRSDLSDAGSARSKNRIAHDMAGLGTDTTAPDGTPSRVLVQGTWNTQIVDELAPHPGDIVVPKHRFSGFFDTDLDAQLRRRRITTLLFAGCTTSICVEATLRDAMYLDYVPILLEDCTAEPQGQQLHDATVTIVESTLGWVSNSRGVAAALS